MSTDDEKFTGSKTAVVDPLLGEVIDDRFELDRVLGSGSVGRVYKGTQLSVGRDVAVKILRGDFRSDPNYSKRFFREARVISGFNHPNIVRLVDFGRDEKRDVPFLVMELVEGRELNRILAEGPLKLPFVLEVAYQVAGALLEAHQADIIHRDLKSENVILVPLSNGRPQAKVLDFGVAFPRGTSVRLTSAGEIFGTPAYMAPEQGEGDAVDSRADLYSLGVIIYEMTTGYLPFSADNNLRMMLEHLKTEPPTLSENLETLVPPEGLEQLVRELLAKDPSDRPAGGGEVRDRIDAIRQRNDVPSVTLEPSRPMETVFAPWVRAGDGVQSADRDSHPGAPPTDRMASSRNRAVSPDTGVPTNPNPGAETEASSPDEKERSDSIVGKTLRIFRRDAIVKRTATAAAVLLVVLGVLGVVAYRLSSTDDGDRSKPIGDEGDIEKAPSPKSTSGSPAESEHRGAAGSQRAPDAGPTSTEALAEHGGPDTGDSDAGNSQALEFDPDEAREALSRPSSEHEREPSTARSDSEQTSETSADSPSERGDEPTESGDDAREPTDETDEENGETIDLEESMDWVEGG